MNLLNVSIQNLPVEVQLAAYLALFALLVSIDHMLPIAVALLELLGADVALELWVRRVRVGRLDVLLESALVPEFLPAVLTLVDLHLYPQLVGVIVPLVLIDVASGVGGEVAEIAGE